MIERIVPGDLFQLIAATAEKRPSGCGEEDVFESLLLPLQALEDSAVLAIDRQDADAIAASGIHNEAARYHKAFLVRQGQVDSTVKRGHCSLQPGGAYHGIQYDIAVCRINQ